MSKQKGFTLVELMVTVAVLAIVLGIAIPSFSSILLNNRISTTAHELHAAMQLARSESIKRKKPIVLCGANAALDECVQNGTNWSSGWLMTLDGEVLRVWEPGRSLDVTGTRGSIEFLGSGMVRDSTVLSVKSQDCSNGVKHTISINRTGRLTLEKGSC